MDKATSSADLDAEQLIKKYQNGIWRYLRSLGCDAAEADDLTQETFLSVLQRRFEQYSDAATSAYLRRTAYNALVTLKRRSGKVVAVENLEAFDNAWTELVRDERGDDLIVTLQGCLQDLTNRARWALEMKFRDKLSRQQIAAKLEITEHGAKNLMQRAKKQLRECVERKTKK